MGDLFPRLIAILLISINIIYLSFLTLNTSSTRKSFSFFLLNAIFIFNFYLIIPLSRNFTLLSVTRDDLTLNIHKKSLLLFFIPNYRREIPIKVIKSISISKRGIISPYLLFKIKLVGEFRSIKFKFRNELPKRLHDDLIFKKNCYTPKSIERNISSLEKWLPQLKQCRKKAKFKIYRPFDYKHMILISLNLFYFVFAISLIGR